MVEYYGHNDWRDYHLSHHGVLGMRWGIRRYQPYGHGGYNSDHAGKNIGDARKKENSTNYSGVLDKPIVRSLTKPGLTKRVANTIGGINDIIDNTSTLNRKINQIKNRETPEYKRLGRETLSTVKNKNVSDIDVGQLNRALDTVRKVKELETQYTGERQKKISDRVSNVKSSLKEKSQSLKNTMDVAGNKMSKAIKKQALKNVRNKYNREINNIDLKINELERNKTLREIKSRPGNYPRVYKNPTHEKRFDKQLNDLKFERKRLVRMRDFELKVVRRYDSKSFRAENAKIAKDIVNDTVKNVRNMYAAALLARVLSSDKRAPYVSAYYAAKLGKGKKIRNRRTDYRIGQKDRESIEKDLRRNNSGNSSRNASRAKALASSGYSQAEIAKKLGVSQSTVSDYING